MRGSAIGKIVAINTGDHHVAQSHLLSHPRDVSWLFRVEYPGMSAFGNRAEAASARAQVAENHEGGGAAMEAFVKIGTARRFTNRMQIEAPELGFQIVNRLKVMLRLAKPVRQARNSWGQLNQVRHDGPCGTRIVSRSRSCPESPRSASPHALCSRRRRQSGRPGPGTCRAFPEPPTESP